MNTDERFAHFIEPVRAGVPVTHQQVRFMEPRFGGTEHGIPKPGLAPAAIT